MQPISGSIPSKQVSDVFVAQVAVSTKSTKGRQMHQGKVDALSRRSYLAPRPGEPAFDNQKQVILGPAWLQAAQVFDMPMDSDVINTIREDLKTDAFAQAILAQIDPSRDF